MLRHPCILEDPQQRGAKPEVATSALPSWGPKGGRKCYVTPTFLGIPNKGEQNHKWLLDPCLLGGPKEGGNAMSPLHSRGSPTPSAGSKTTSGPHQGEQIRSGYLTPAFSGAQKRAEMLRNPCVLAWRWGSPRMQV